MAMTLTYRFERPGREPVDALLMSAPHSAGNPVYLKIGDISDSLLLNTPPGDLRSLVENMVVLHERIVGDVAQGAPNCEGVPDGR